MNTTRAVTIAVIINVTKKVIAIPPAGLTPPLLRSSDEASQSTGSVEELRKYCFQSTLYISILVLYRAHIKTLILVTNVL